MVGSNFVWLTGISGFLFFGILHRSVAPSWDATILQSWESAFHYNSGVLVELYRGWRTQETRSLISQWIMRKTESKKKRLLHPCYLESAPNRCKESLVGAGKLLSLCDFWIRMCILLFFVFPNQIFVYSKRKMRCWPASYSVAAPCSYPWWFLCSQADPLIVVR